MDALRLSALVRSALMVSDLAQSTRFYGDVLGLTDVYWEGLLQGRATERLLSVPEGTVCNARILKATAEAMGMVGLFEISNPSSSIGPPRVQKARTPAHIGEAFLVFYASNLDIVVERLEASGYDILCPPLAFEHDGQVKQREMACADPDGFKLNLIEWDPALEKRPELTPGKVSR